MQSRAHGAGQSSATTNFAEGDVFIGNDPHSTGAMHANDFQAVAPIFLGEHCIGFCYLHAHMLDVGGIVPGSWGVGATDCYGEAFRMPFVKYVEDGIFNETVQRILSKNSRLPAALLNDIQSMVVAALAGAKQIRDLGRALRTVAIRGHHRGVHRAYRASGTQAADGTAGRLIRSSRLDGAQRTRQRSVRGPSETRPWPEAVFTSSSPAFRKPTD